MTTISPHGKSPQGPQGPQTRGEEIFGDIVVGTWFTVLGSVGTVLMIGLLAGAVAGSVQFLASETGLLAAWVALAQISQTRALSAERIASLLLDNLLFGALVGLVLGFMHFVLRWRRERDRRVVEALISPSGLAAASYGAVCLFLHVAISVAAAWALGALFGVFLPSPAGLIAGHDAGIVFQTFVGAGDGGDGGPGGELAVRLLLFLTFVLLLAAVLVCNIYAAAGWVFFRAGSAAAEGAIAGGVSGVSASAMAMMVRLAISRIRGEKDVRRLRHDLEDNGRSFRHAFVTGALTGAAHTVVYAAIVFAASALYGIEVAP